LLLVVDLLRDIGGDDNLRFRIHGDLRVVGLNEAALVRVSPFFGQKNGLVKVDCCPLVRLCVFVFVLSLIKNPLTWTEPSAYSTPVGEAEAGSAGEHPVKE
jgi:hypothetical protein